MYKIYAIFLRVNIKTKEENMNTLFIAYPKCSTCQKAKKWLEQNNIEFEDRHIIENNPSKEELKKWIKQSGYEIKKFFNKKQNIKRNNVSRKNQNTKRKQVKTQKSR